MYRARFRQRTEALDQAGDVGLVSDCIMSQRQAHEDEFVVQLRDAVDCSPGPLDISRLGEGPGPEGEPPWVIRRRGEDLDGTWSPYPLLSLDEPHQHGFALRKPRKLEPHALRSP